MPATMMRAEVRRAGPPAASFSQRFLLIAFLLALGAGLASAPLPALAATCTWTGTTSADWHTAGNWTGCGGTPSSSDDVTLPSGSLPNETAISSADVSIHSLNIQSGRTVTLGSSRVLTATGTTINYGTVAGSGTFRTHGSAYLYNYATFSAPLEVASGTTDAWGTFGSTLTVASDATLRVLDSSSYTMTVNGDATIDGTLSGNGSYATFVFNGATFTNNGAVSVAYVQFYGSGSQNLGGAGTWTGSGIARIGGASTTSLLNAVTFGTSLYVNSGGMLALGSHTLTLNGKTLYNYGAVAGSGTFRTQGSADLYNRATFSAPLEVITGTTDARGTFGSTLNVASSATLRVVDDSSYPMTVNGDATIDGTLSGNGSYATFVFNGATFTNNGAVSVADVQFYGSGSQNLGGAGTWTGSGIARIGGASTTSLLNAVTFETSLYVNSGGVLALGSHTLTLNGKTLYNYGALTGSGTFRTQGSADLYNRATFSAPLEVLTGTTDARGTFGSTLNVASSATLRVVDDSSYPMTVNGDATIDGALSGDGSYATFVFNGATFTNNGAVSVAYVQFYGSGSQNLGGAGTWTGSGIARIGGASTTSLLNTVIFGTSLYVNSGGMLALGSHTLTLNGQTLYNYGAVTGSGTFRTQGSADLYNRATFSAPLEVLTGTTDARGTFGSTLNVASSATLRVVDDSSYPMTVNGDATIDGALSGDGSSATFIFNGATFTNNGAVSVFYVRFAGGAQTLVGTGSFSANYTTILSGATVTLGSNHQMSTVFVNSGGTLDITGRTLALSGAGTPLTNSGTLTTTGSVIVYNGSSAQTVATANVNYYSLTVDNPASVTLSAAKTISGTLTLARGTFSVGGNLTLGNAAMISRATGTLSAAPKFGATAHLEYTGGTSVMTGPELPISPTILSNLAVDKSDGVTVTLDANATVNGTFTLTAGVLDVNTRTLTLRGPVSGDGVLVSAATGAVIYDQNTTGQNVLAADYGNLIFSNFNKTLPASGMVRIAGAFTPGAATGHTIAGSTVEFNGAGAQTINGAMTFYNLTIANTTPVPDDGADVSTNAAVTVVNALNVNDGQFRPSTGSTFRDVTIAALGILKPASGASVSVSGGFTNSGAFMANGGAVTFNGAGTQNLAAYVATAFNNLTVNAGVALVETVAADNATAGSALTNAGVIRKAQAIAGPGPLAFGLTGVRAIITGTGTLSSLQVDRVDVNGPTATVGVRTGRYWTLTPNGGADGFTASLTLPHSGLVDPTACRYNGDFWDCDRASFNGVSVTREGVIAFSDWAVGDGIAPAVTPVVTINLSAPNVVLVWPPHNAANAEGYRIWYSADPYFLPGASGAISVTVLAPTTDYTHTSAAGSGSSYFYLVQGRNAAGAPSGPSNRTGIFSFGLKPGTP